MMNNDIPNKIPTVTINAVSAEPFNLYVIGIKVFPAMAKSI